MTDRRAPAASQDLVLTPVGPYSLAASIAHRRNPSRRRLDSGGVELVLSTSDPRCRASVWQRGDGTLLVRLSEGAGEVVLPRLRFVLAIDDDHTAFVEAFGDDPLIGASIRRSRGLRPMRTLTVAHAVLRAFAGQLITTREAALIERRVMRAVGVEHDGWVTPPSLDGLRGLTQPDLVGLGLAPRRASAFAHLLRTVNLDALHGRDRAAVVGRLAREPMVGPWSIGVIALEGLGRYDLGLAGDLGLMRLCTQLHGRPAEVDDTLELLARYEPWSGLASTHLLRHPLAHVRGVPRRRRG